MPYPVRDKNEGNMSTAGGREQERTMCFYNDTLAYETLLNVFKCSCDLGWEVKLGPNPTQATKQFSTILSSRQWTQKRINPPIHRAHLQIPLNPPTHPCCRGPTQPNPTNPIQRTQYPRRVRGIGSYLSGRAHACNVIDRSVPHSPVVF